MIRWMIWSSNAAGIVIPFDIRTACNVENTLLAGLASSSSNWGFACQLAFMVLWRFVVHFAEFLLSYVKYFPFAITKGRRILFLHFVCLFFVHLDIRFDSDHIRGLSPSSYLNKMYLRREQREEVL